MGRPNPEVEHLRRMNAAYKRVQDRLLADPGDVPFTACDNSCVCVTATGMATNGGCRCDERKLRHAVRYWRRRAQFLQTTIQVMRGDWMPSDEPAPAGESEREKEEGTGREGGGG